MNPHAGVAAVGDVLDIACWSSTPYFFYQAGEKAGMFDQPWALKMDHFDGPRKWWNMKRMLTGHKPGGFQYSNSFLDKAEAQIPESFFSSAVISMNQTFPRASSVIRAGGKMHYYVDATLHDLFREQAYEISIPQDMQNHAIAIERENYHQAAFVVSMGSWVHESLRTFYKLPESKIRHILPGANMVRPAGFLFSDRHGRPGKDRELVLGFVGKDWKRKGLGFLLDVRDDLVASGYQVIIKAIGHCPEELKNRPGLEYTGFIDKQTDTERFIREISSCDVGCLYSKSEALGISTLEFLRVGVPVAGFFHQGLKDTLFQEASLRAQPDATVEAVKQQFAGFIEDHESRAALIQEARRLAEEVTWEKAVGKWKTLLA